MGVWSGSSLFVTKKLLLEAGSTCPKGFPEHCIIKMIETQTMSIDTSFERGEQEEDSSLLIKKQPDIPIGYIEPTEILWGFPFPFRKKRFITFYPKFNIKRRKCWQHPQWCYASCLCQVKCSVTGSRGSTWIQPPSTQCHSAPPSQTQTAKQCSMEWAYPDSQLSAKATQEKKHTCRRQKVVTCQTTPLLIAPIWSSPPVTERKWIRHSSLV